MRRMLYGAIIVAAVTAALEGLAVVLGWSPATWLLAALPATAGVVAFLTVGRLRAVRREARRRARPCRRSAADCTDNGIRAVRSGHVTVVRSPRAPAGSEAGLVPLHMDEDTLAPR